MTDHKDLIERLAWPVNPNAPKDEVTLPAWVRELCAEAASAIETVQVERDAEIRADERAKVIEGVLALRPKHVTLGGQRYSVILREDINAFHTDASRALQIKEKEDE